MKVWVEVVAMKLSEDLKGMWAAKKKIKKELKMSPKFLVLFKEEGDSRRRRNTCWYEEWNTTTYYCCIVQCYRSLFIWSGFQLLVSFIFLVTRWLPSATRIICFLIQIKGRGMGERGPHHTVLGKSPVVGSHSQTISYGQGNTIGQD